MPLVYSEVVTPIPTPIGGELGAQVRSSPYGDVAVAPLQSVSDARGAEGSQFIAMGATPNTSILTPNNTSLTETAPALVIYNGSLTKTYVLDFVRVVNTVIPTSSLDLQMVCTIDNTNRYTSGGTGLIVQNVNMAAWRDSNANVVFGNITASAASASRRLVEFLVCKTAVITVRDQFIFNFGQIGTSTHSNFANQSVTASNYSFNLGPIAIGPNHTFLMYLYYASAAAASSYIPVVSWYER